MLFPLLTEADPAVTGEGSIDPLGLYAIADSLAVRLIPGVRERQVHPRFLTAIAVSLAVCSEFEEDTVAVDRISEPWQVFEWYMVEGLVRTISADTQLRGLPGREKSAKAIQDGVPLSAKRYLKAPSIYGFHGVYRLLSHTLGVEIRGRLGEFGHDLLSTWAEEQGLKGFWGTANGPGADVRRQIRDAVSDGLKKGAIDRSWGWSGWQFFRKHLDHNSVGRRESQRITQALLKIKSGFRQPVLEFLISPEGQRIWNENDSERVFHKALAAARNSSLQELLTAILTYEDFARLMQDAF
ncbi:MAG TPA: hypothetical protein PLZ55_01830, partial [bacterium]|nr:hypothetical protein [bacterium]